VARSRLGNILIAYREWTAHLSRILKKLSGSTRRIEK
jgi:hypothetical protein